MALRHKERPFAELGNLIESWRLKHHPSALSLYKAAKKPFSFSYSSYADFEKGVALPRIEQVLEIANHFGESREIATLTWARVQVPTDLRGLFAQERDRRITPRSSALSKAPASAGTKDAVAPLSLENTWVFGPQEKEMLLKEASLIDAFLLMAVEFPKPVPAEHFGVLAMHESIRTLIAQGRILESEEGFRLKEPYFHIPKTEEWKIVREQNFMRAARSMLGAVTTAELEEGIAFHDIITRKLTHDEVRKLITHLRTVREEMLRTSPGGERHVYSYVVALAPRRLKKIAKKF